MTCKQRAMIGTIALLSLLLLWSVHTEPYSHTPAAAAPRDLSALLAQDCWSAADYRILAEQTGLFPPALDLLRERGALDTLPAVQRAYLSPAAVRCRARMLVTRAERLENGSGLPAALEDGDILITPCTHTLGFRNGHAALVVDAEQGTTLEAVVIGTDSALKKIARWTRYPAFAVYRLRGVSAEDRSAIAQAAKKRLAGVPYSLLTGWYPAKRMPGTVETTQCAHLVWEAFAAFGYDLDENGGCIVTPADLARSPLLELKQVYGLPFSWPEG